MHESDHRSVRGYVERYIGTPYDKILAIANVIPQLLELLEYFRIHNSDGNVDSRFTFTQAGVSDHWVINHNLGKYPSVDIINPDGETVEGVIDHIDDNNLTIDFSEPVSGIATLN